MTGIDDELDDFLLSAEEEPAKPLATDGELVETMREVATLRTRKAELEAELKVVNSEIRTKNDIILATYDARGINKMSVEGAGLFYVQSSPYPSVTNKPAFLDWIDFRNMGEIAPRSVNFQTLRRWVKERMLIGAELPDPTVVAIHIDRQIRVRKG
jgi:hypothetical protein